MLVIPPKNNAKDSMWSTEIAMALPFSNTCNRLFGRNRDINSFITSRRSVSSMSRQFIIIHHFLMENSFDSATHLLQFSSDNKTTIYDEEKVRRRNENIQRAYSWKRPFDVAGRMKSSSGVSVIRF